MKVKVGCTRHMVAHSDDFHKQEDICTPLRLCLVPGHSQWLRNKCGSGLSLVPRLLCMGGEKREPGNEARSGLGMRQATSIKISHLSSF